MIEGEECVRSNVIDSSQISWNQQKQRWRREQKYTAAVPEGSNFCSHCCCCCWCRHEIVFFGVVFKKRKINEVRRKISKSTPHIFSLFVARWCCCASNTIYAAVPGLPTDVHVVLLFRNPGTHSAADAQCLNVLLFCHLWDFLLCQYSSPLSAARHSTNQMMIRYCCSF